MPRKNIHPSFKKKPVLQLECRSCGRILCDRGMKAILLADVNIELYSTDCPPANSVDLVFDAYCTEKCKCHIKDVACLGCGNVVGYTVVRPCKPCLTSCNNGHLWMFHSTAVFPSDRLDCKGEELLVWGELADNEELETEEECFR